MIKQGLVCLPVTKEIIPAIWGIEKELPGFWTERQFYDELTIPTSWNFVISAHDVVLGYIFGTMVLDEAEIRKIAVAPNFRRQGLATTLLNEAFRFLVKHKIVACFLEVRQKNKGALCLYQKNNFKQIAIRKNYYTSPKDNAILLKKICTVRNY